VSGAGQHHNRELGRRGFVAGERGEMQYDGTVLQHQRGDLFEVSFEVGGSARKVWATRSGKLRTRHLQIVVGDRVRVELSPYDIGRGRIVNRLQ
jgi:translation initiation factor IF-1